MKRNFGCLLFIALLGIGVQKHGYSANIELDWISQQQRSAVGRLDDVFVTAATSSEAQFLSVVGGRFSGTAWNTERPLSADAEGLVVSDANPGDTHTFVFTQPIPDLLFYVENFDSNSSATITAEGTGSFSLLEGSPSISYSATSDRSGVLSTSNSTFNGEGDLVLSLQGSVESISLDFSSGDGQNGVFYTFAIAPEPSGIALLLLGTVLLGTLRGRRNQLAVGRQ